MCILLACSWSLPRLFHQSSVGHGSGLQWVTERRPEFRKEYLSYGGSNRVASVDCCYLFADMPAGEQSDFVISSVRACPEAPEGRSSLALHAIASPLKSTLAISPN